MRGTRVSRYSPSYPDDHHHHNLLLTGGGGGIGSSSRPLLPMLPPPRLGGGGIGRYGVSTGRTTAASCFRTGVFVFLVTFLWLQMHMASVGTGSSAGGKGASSSSGTSDAEAAAQKQLLAMIPPSLHKFLLPKNGSAVFNDSSTFSGGSAMNISAMRREIEALNGKQQMFNEDLFGPVLNDSLVVVVQVHTRVTYLRHLVVSLAQAQGVEGILLVVSHDFFDPEINDLVRSIDFCKVIQVFYPTSIQTHPFEFPGESPADCPRNAKKEEALATRCINAEHPDLYGHYREAKFTQTKHHWWWKANRVFDQLDVLRNHTGLVLFLEEDHYVAEDFIHVLRLMERTCRANCEKCNILSLGTYLKTYNYYGDAKNKEGARAKRLGLSAGNIPPSWNYQLLPTLYQHYQKAEVTPWVSSKHNMGMAFNRSVWKEVRRCARWFCTYDDYNWDWSLQQVSQGCMHRKLHAMVMKGPRVFHIGECGVHHKKSNCESTAAIAKVQQVLKHAAKHLYPAHLTLTFTTNHKKQKVRRGNGGWGDLRDHQLCLNMTRPTPPR